MASSLSNKAHSPYIPYLQHKPTVRNSKMATHQHHARGLLLLLPRSRRPSRPLAPTAR